MKKHLYLLAVAVALAFALPMKGAFAQGAPEGGQTAETPSAPKAPKRTPAKKTASAKKSKAAKKAKTKTGENSLDALKDAGQDYKVNKEVKTEGGNASIDCGDEVAKKLRGKPLKDVYEAVAKVLAPEETVNSLKKRYGHLNEGMQRMNLGNRMRGIINAK